MPKATDIARAPPINQINTAPPGPAALKAAGKAEMPPARIQMIENDIAKLEKPLIRRASSWAYPILCNTCLSCSCTLSAIALSPSMKLKRILMGRSVSLALCHRHSLRIGNECTGVNHWDFLFTTHLSLNRDGESPGKSKEKASLSR